MSIYNPEWKKIKDGSWQCLEDTGPLEIRVYRVSDNKWCVMYINTLSGHCCILSRAGTKHTPRSPHPIRYSGVNEAKRGAFYYRFRNTYLYKIKLSRMDIPGGKYNKMVNDSPTDDWDGVYAR